MISGAAEAFIEPTPLILMVGLVPNTSCIYNIDGYTSLDCLSNGGGRLSLYVTFEITATEPTMDCLD